MFDNFNAVDEGDKIEIENDENIYVVTWVGISVKAEPVGDSRLSDKIKFEKDELETKIENGEVRVLTETEPTTTPGREISEHIDIEQLVSDLEGRKGLRTSKPDGNGLTQYIWRMARFHAGYDTCMPVMAASWLQDYLDENGIDAKVRGIMDDAGKEVRDELEKAVDAVIVGFDENPAFAAQEWKKAGAF